MASTSKSAMTAARQAAQKIDLVVNEEVNHNHNYLDLWDLADQMAAQGIAIPQSEAVKAAIDAAVINTNSRSSGNHDYSNTHGLSIFWPEGTDGFYPDYISNQIYVTTSESTWDEFLRTYNSSTTRPGIPLEPEPTAPLPAKDIHIVYLPVVRR
jgi:hypothetical protein